MMNTVTRISDMRTLVTYWRQQNLKVALVPTMGNLHAGHLSLVKRAKMQADKVVVSIFVNPTQFGINEDFEAYPRTFEADREQLLQADCDAIFLPSIAEMYPEGINQQTQIRACAELADQLCGQSRLGHFDGVCLIVNKLLNIIQPDFAIFGEKDRQQLLIVNKMVHDLNMGVHILSAPTIREANGLALSSRNQYLSHDERLRAVILYQALVYANNQLNQSREDFVAIEAESRELIAMQGLRVDYFALRTVPKLSTVINLHEPIGIFVAAFLGNTRLIDNLLWQPHFISTS